MIGRAGIGVPSSCEMPRSSDLDLDLDLALALDLCSALLPKISFCE